METHLRSNATVMVVVGPGVNKQSMAKNDIATTNENNPVNIKILENDEDPNGETLTTKDCVHKIHVNVAINDKVSTFEDTPVVIDVCWRMILIQREKISKCSQQ